MRSLLLVILFLLSLSGVVLNSIGYVIFTWYFLLMILGIGIFWFFSQIGFDVVSLFSKHLYIVSIFLLILTIIIGQVTRGTVRWIQLGIFSLQPAEVVRPFLFVFFANYLTSEKLTLKRSLKSVLLAIIPIFLIFVQPSLGVSILTSVGFLGILMATSFNKKYLLIGLIIFAISIPIIFQFLAPYQKERILTLGTNYNSIQSTIAAGSGGIFGRGLGHGIQTQLAFLPEKQTDFIFAATSEELGFLGAGLMLLATGVILFKLTEFMENAVSPAGRAYISGFFLTYLIQVFIHTGMNMGMLPVTGLPFPLVSAGGSSLLATMIGLGIAVGAKKS